VVVIGAGVTGLSVAYELQKAGREVVVLDRGRIGGGLTAIGAGHLSLEPDGSYDALVRQHGPDAARASRESRTAAVNRIEAVCREGGIDADFARIDGYLISASVDDNEFMDREHAAARGAGLLGVDFVNEAPLKGRDTGAALHFPDQARFHPLKYGLGLAEAFERLGGRIFGDTPVTALESLDGGVLVTLEDGTVLRPAQAVSAGDGPLGVGLPFHARQAPNRTYLIAAEIETGTAADILLWDTAQPYTSARVQPRAGHDLLIVGGQDHRSGTADDAEIRFGALEAWARLRYPEMSEVSHRWSARYFEPADTVPFIGALPGAPGLFLVTGGGREDAVTGAIASLILPDLMAGRANPWSGLYDPARTGPAGAGVAEFVKERAGVVGHLVERLTPGEVKALDDLQPGVGAVVRTGLSKTAAYRDPEGGLHQRSAVCSLTGCLVHFNSWDRSWDCPCHGCRFDVDGAVLAGPATQPLGPGE
jgi:glycine/D-amino acid oxidase-like deaminating enzyme/nitrite reductase/ring-hydroxylating ferredoxin subunit